MQVSASYEHDGSGKPETEHMYCSARKHMLCSRFEAYLNVRSAEVDTTVKNPAEGASSSAKTFAGAAAKARTDAAAFQYAEEKLMKKLTVECSMQ